MNTKICMLPFTWRPSYRQKMKQEFSCTRTTELKLYMRKRYCNSTKTERSWFILSCPVELKRHASILVKALPKWATWVQNYGLLKF